ncbi:MAG TPA: hypothetical protein VFZ56_10420 [Gemmatimonadaceae bacterium]
MRSSDLHRSLPSLFSELVYGVPDGPAFVLNRGDAGLLKSLDTLTAREASRSTNGGATVAAHVDHLRYGLSLLNRWSSGENPFRDADWSAAWKTAAVNDADWMALRRNLREEVERWHAALQSDREVGGAELDGVVGSLIHLAYHLGAIRQIAAALRGPKESA